MEFQINILSIQKVMQILQFDTKKKRIPHAASL